MVAVPAGSAVRVPFSTDNTTDVTLPSASLTEICLVPVNARGASTGWTPGKLFVGAVLAGTAALDSEVLPVGSVAVAVTHSLSATTTDIKVQLPSGSVVVDPR